MAVVDEDEHKNRELVVSRFPMRMPSALNHERRHPVFTKKMSVAILPASSKIAFAGSCMILWGMS